MRDPDFQLRPLLRFGRWARSLLVGGALVIAPACAFDADATVVDDESEITAGGPRYGEVARELTRGKFEPMVEALGRVHGNTLPHEAQTLRTTVGEMRDLMEIFAFAYPDEANGTGWRKELERLKDGYSAVGEFKDLFDAQYPGRKADARPEDGARATEGRLEDVRYDPVELAEKRKVMLAWVARYLERKPLDRTREFVLHPDPKKLFHRKASEIGKTYWGGVDTAPREGKSANTNLSELTRALLDKAKKETGAVFAIADVRSNREHKAFHDYRKRVRAIGKLFDYFPDLKPQDPKAVQIIQSMKALVEQLGIINDMITGYEKTKDAAQRADKGQQIDQAWAKLRSWQRSEKFEEKYPVLADAMKRKK
jgi:cytochrome c556